MENSVKAGFQQFDLSMCEKKLDLAPVRPSGAPAIVEK